MSVLRPGRRQRADICSTAASANSASRPSKGVAAAVFKRWERLLEAGRAQLVEPLRLVEVLELVLSEVAERDVR